MKNLILDLSKETNSIGKKLYIAGFPCIFNKKCETIELENYLRKISNETNLFKIMPLSNNIYQEHKNDKLDGEVIFWHTDGTLWKSLHYKDGSQSDMTSIYHKDCQKN